MSNENHIDNSNHGNKTNDQSIASVNQDQQSSNDEQNTHAVHNLSPSDSSFKIDESTSNIIDNVQHIKITDNIDNNEQFKQNNLSLENESNIVINSEQDQLSYDQAEMMSPNHINSTNSLPQSTAAFQLTTTPLAALPSPVIITGYLANDIENSNIAISQWTANPSQTASGLYISHPQYPHYEYTYSHNSGSYITPTATAYYTSQPYGLIQGGSQTYPSYNHSNIDNSYHKHKQYSINNKYHRNGYRDHFPSYAYDLNNNNNYNDNNNNNNNNSIVAQQTNRFNKKNYKNLSKETDQQNSTVNYQNNKEEVINSISSNSDQEVNIINKVIINDNHIEDKNSNLKKKWSDIVSGSNDKKQNLSENTNTTNNDSNNLIDSNNQDITEESPDENTAYYHNIYNTYGYDHHYTTYDPGYYHQPSSYYDPSHLNYYTPEIYSLNLHFMPKNQNYFKNVYHKKYDYLLKNSNLINGKRSYFKQRNNNPNSDISYSSKYNPCDFVFNGENINNKNNSGKKSKCFVIKSYSVEDVVHSIKHGIWCSTEQGNQKLDNAYNEVKKHSLSVYLFFSVNGSGQFCGMAEMISNVDYTNSASHIWTQDKWKGQFKVNWIFVKDVPNIKLKHIIMPNNENKPVTNSRDTQEVFYEQALLVLDVFNKSELKTSILDEDNNYFDDENEENKINSNNDEPASNTNSKNGFNGFKNGKYYQQNYYYNSNRIVNNKSSFHASKLSTPNQFSSSSASSNRINTNKKNSNKTSNNGAQQQEPNE